MDVIDLFLLYIQNGAADWMFLDKNLVDLSGTVCDKVGVSHAAFRNANNACQQVDGR